ncbi:MAG: hypothetical protein LUQ38_03580 [Methanotrichaceae archaeon]|nr:hypothetical protein [Methanotrichaceae archaeon]
MTSRTTQPYVLDYPDWRLNESGHQYDPRIYQYAELQQIPNLVYANETAYTEARK